MNPIRRIYDSKASPLLLVAGLLLFWMESRRTLRRRTQPRWKRVVTNAIVAIPSFTLLRFLLLPVMVHLAFRSRKGGFGLAHRFDGPPAVKALAVFLLLDYTNYLWHVLMHKWPLLWRFHVVHHCDLDLDITTGFRFHFGELVGSVFYRGGAIYLIGASPLTVLIYEAIFEGATQFHHTNMKLPYRAEKVLSKVIVTPRMHGIHHSMIRQETDSNYSVIFSFWDRLHRTLRLNVPQDLIVTGVPAYSNPEEQTVAFLWKLPFTAQRGWEAVNERQDIRSTGQVKTILAE